MIRLMIVCLWISNLIPWQLFKIAQLVQQLDALGYFIAIRLIDLALG